MAIFTITSSVNIDSLTGKTGGDTYNLAGGYLTIDQDSRYGLNQTISCSLGTSTISASLGGTIRIDGTAVRLIPYDTGTGNVPVSNTTISMGGASGLLLGVYSALNVAPTASGAAMPASGYIKIKQWNGVAYSAGALSGISANCTGVDVAGWIEVAGDEAGLLTLNRLGSCVITGSYYEIGTTDGTRATTYQIPSHGLLQYHAGVEVETSSSSGLYEFYTCAGTLSALSASIATDEIRGKVCWISTAGLLRFGHDGTNSTGGFIPPAGRKIRIGNVFLANCATAARWANVLPAASPLTRYEFATTGGGVLSIERASVSWYLNLNQPYSISLNNIGVCTVIVLTECASAISWNNVNVGQEAANTQIALTINYCFAGGTISNSTFTRAAQATAVAVVSMTDNNDFTFTNCHSRSMVKAANAGATSFNVTRGNNFTFTNTTMGGGKMLLTTCADVTCTGTVYYDTPSLTTSVAVVMYAFEVASNCTRCTFDGLTFGGLRMVQPYSGILSILAAGCKEIKLRNLGTYASPLDLGDTIQEGVSWTRSTTTCTVTKVGHGLKTNDVIYVTQASVAATTITIASKTITRLTDDTFTFTCLNAGAASGTLTYFPSVTQTMVIIATSAAANDVRVQRCYASHLRTSPFTSDNSSKNVLFESVFGDWTNTYLTPYLNGKTKGVSGIPVFTAQTSCYGTHFVNNFVGEFPQNTVAQAWTRSSTTATVTANGHQLRTGMFINVIVSSDESAITLGQKTVVLAATANTFTFTCLNAGAASGTLTFVPLIDRFAIMMNESTAETSGQYTIDSGSAAFTSAGSLYMPNVNDQITFETPDYVLGYLNFPIAEAVMAGGTLTNYDVTYAINTGSGYSSFKSLSYPRAGGGGSGASTTVTMTDTTGVQAGDYVYGTNINGNNTVVSVDNGTTITVSAANLGTVSGILRFSRLPLEGNIPSTGFKMKIRFKTTTANLTAITSLLFYLSSTTTTRAYQYPLDQYTLTFTGLQNPSEVRIFDAANPTVEITGQEDVTTGTYSGLIDPVQYPTVIAAILSLGYQNIRLTDIDMTSGDVSIPVQQQVDRQYG